MTITSLLRVLIAHTPFRRSLIQGQLVMVGDGPSLETPLMCTVRWHLVHGPEPIDTNASAYVPAPKQIQSLAERVLHLVDGMKVLPRPSNATRVTPLSVKEPIRRPTHILAFTCQEHSVGPRRSDCFRKIFPESQSIAFRLLGSLSK